MQRKYKKLKQAVEAADLPAMRKMMRPMVKEITEARNAALETFALVEEMFNNTDEAAKLRARKH